MSGSGPWQSEWALHHGACGRAGEAAAAFEGSGSAGQTGQGAGKAAGGGLRGCQRAPQLASVLAAPPRPGFGEGGAAACVCLAQCRAGLSEGRRSLLPSHPAHPTLLRPAIPPQEAPVVHSAQGGAGRPAAGGGGGGGAPASCAALWLHAFVGGHLVAGCEAAAGAARQGRLLLPATSLGWRASLGGGRIWLQLLKCPQIEAAHLFCPLPRPLACRAAALGGRGASWTARMTTASAASTASSRRTAMTLSRWGTRPPTRGWVLVLNLFLFLV